MTTTEFRTGKDYPWLCEGCRAVIDQCAYELETLGGLGDRAIESGRLLISLDDDEAPSDWAYDRGLFCGGHECSCDCSIGFPLLDKELDVFCRAHGGTEEEQQSASEQLCEKNGHWFPHMRDGYCLACRKVYGASVISKR